MKRVGITGGMGCGKSTVVAEFRALGVPCFVCDTVAARYYYDIDFLDDLRRLLGNGVFLSDGSVEAPFGTRFTMIHHHEDCQIAQPACVLHTPHHGDHSGHAACGDCPRCHGTGRPQP